MACKTLEPAEDVAIATLVGMGAAYNPRRIDPDQLAALRVFGARGAGRVSQPGVAPS